MNSINFPVGVTSPQLGGDVRLLGQWTEGGRNVQIYNARHGGHHAQRREMDFGRHLRMGGVAWNNHGGSRCYGWLCWLARASVGYGCSWREKVT